MHTNKTRRFLFVFMALQYEFRVSNDWQNVKIRHNRFKGLQLDIGDNPAPEPRHISTLIKYICIRVIIMLY